MTNRRLIDAYVDGIDALRETFRGLDRRALTAHPVPGTWSLLEIVCHLADAEVLFTDRMKRVLIEDRPAFTVADPGRSLAALAAGERDAGEEIELVAALRRQMARILRALPDEAWSRVGLHSRDGERTLEQLLQKSVDHLEHHLRFARQKRDLLTGG